MSYNKLGFTSGQTLKAEHLNHMEDGIANAGKGSDNILWINGTTEDYKNYVFDKSFSQIKSHLTKGGNAFVKVRYGYGFGPRDYNDYIVPFVGMNEDYITFSTDSTWSSKGKLVVSFTSEGEIFVDTSSYLPFPNGRGRYLVGVNNFQWEIEKGPVIYSPNGTKYMISVDDNGALSAVKA
jgi:hypothetical protein